MPRTALHETLDRLDRALGARVRDYVARRARTARALGIAADAMSPAFRFVVLVLILWRPTRARGARALVAAVSAATIAKRVRDGIARPRPGARTEGALPSRHAAAAVAIAAILAERRRGLRLPMAVITAAGLIGRISSSAHDPADVLAGALLGGMVARLIGRLGRPRPSASAATDGGRRAARR